MEIPSGTVAAALILICVCLLALMSNRIINGRARRAESAAEMVEKRALAILQAMPHMAWMKDASGHLLFANTTYEKYSGKSADSIVGKRTSEIWPPDIADPTEMADQKAMKEGTPVATEVAMDIPNVGIRIVHVTRVPVLDQSGLPAGIVGIGEDVTSQKLADQYRKLTSCVFDGSSEGIVVADSHGRIVAANPAIQDITGYSASELEGSLIEELHPAKNQGEARMRQRLALESGRWTGETIGIRSNGQHYPQRLHLDVVKNTKGHITNFVAIVSDITEQRKHDQEVIYLAQHDQLTGLANRHYFSEWLNEAMSVAEELKAQVAVMFIDVDGFKSVNDSLGHAMGDKLLQAVAERIKSSIPSGCKAARIGGDEFLVGVRQSQAREFYSIAAGIRDALSPIYQIDGCDLSITASIGYSIYPDDSDTSEHLIMQADMAMYQAKALGRNQVQEFTKELREKIEEFNDIATLLKAKTILESLAVRYQPKVDMRTGELSGFEALIRWNHPVRGEMLPSRFIEIAEETGSIVHIGNIVLSRVCQQILTWGENALPVAINISAVQMKQADFVEGFVSAIDAFGVKRNLIEIEITESVLIADKDDVIRKIQGLRKSGIRVALDDFGSGYSSLSYLTSLPIDSIKIDQSFVSKLPCANENDAVIRFLVSLSERLKLSLIAEGVENCAQADQLIRAGCSLGQGWLYGKPLLSDEASLMLAKHLAPELSDSKTTSKTPPRDYSSTRREIDAAIRY